jgi:hypothetical protein
MIVNIGGMAYSVMLIAGLVHPKNEQRLDGHIIYSDCEIRIERAMALQAKFQILWHEIIHAIITHSGQKELSEGTIDALAYGIVGVLMSNQDLMKGLEKEELKP